MLIVKSKRYVKKYRVGGEGILDTLSGFFGRLIASNSAKSVAANLSKAAASDIGKSAINAGKTIAKELATSAISAAKDAAIEKGKQLITQRSKNILESLVNTGQDAKIEDLARRLNGGGLRLA